MKNYFDIKMCVCVYFFYHDPTVLLVSNFTSLFFEEIETVTKEFSHFPATKFAQLSAFIPKPCPLSYVWKNCFCSYSRPASPFVLQISALSTLVYYHFPLLGQEFLSVDHFISRMCSCVS